MVQAVPPEGTQPVDARGRSLRAVRRAEDQTLVTLRLALNAAREGVLVCDAEDRIVFCNRTCAEMVGVQIDPGMTFEAAFRTCLASGKFPDAVGKEEQWIARGMEERHHPGEGMEMRVGERWVHLRNQRTPDGGMLTLIVDITERKLSQQRLAESEAKYRSLVELSSDWFWEQDQTGRFTAISARGIRLKALEEVSLGKARWELPGLEPLEGDWAAHRAKYQRHEPFEDFLVRRTNPEGDVSFLSSSGAPVFSADGRLVGYRGMTRDVTERMRSLLALAESASLFRAIFEQAAVGIVKASLDGRLLEVNQKVCDMLGYTRQELLTLTSLDISAPEDHDVARSSLKRIANGEVATLVREKVFQCKDGSRLCCNLSLNVVRTAAGRAEYVVAVIEDISPRKAAEAAARQATARLRDGLEHLGEMIVLTDADDRIVLANQRFVQFNAAVAEHTRPGNYYADHLRAGLRLGLFPEAAGREEAWLAERMEIRRNPRGPVERKRQDGRWLLVDDQRLPDGGMVSFGVEITERKQAEEQARVARAQLEMAVQFSRVSTWVHDLAAGTCTLSAGWAELLGEPAHEMVVSSQDVLRWAHPEELPSLMAAYVAVAKGERDTYAVEQRVLTRTGEWKWILSRGRIIERDKSGRALLMVGTNVDITDTKRAQEATFAARQRLSVALDLSRVAMWETDLENDRIQLTEGHQALISGPYGRPMLSRQELAEAIHPDDLPAAKHSYLAAIKGTVPQYLAEYRLRTPDGGWVAVLSRGRISARSETGRALAMVGVNIDISERRMAEDAARAAEARLRLALSFSQILAWELDTASDQLTITDVWSDERSPVMRTVSRRDYVNQMVHPDDVEPYGRAYVAALKGPEDRYEAKLRFRTRPGQWKWQLLRGSVTARDATGRALKVMGVQIDISDLKQAEDALRASEQRFRSLVTLSHELFWETDERHRFISQSHSENSPMPYSGKIQYGKTRWEIPYVAPDEEGWAQHRAQLDARQVFVDFEVGRPTTDGSIRYAAISGEPVFDEQQRFMGYRGVSKDITERKRAEFALRNLNIDLERKVAERTAALELAYRELESFSYSVSHDLRAPLRSISGFASMLREEEGQNLTPDGLRYLTVMDESARRMGRLIDALLSLARTSRHVLSHETVDLDALAQSVLSELAPHHPRAQVSVDPLPQVQGDLVLLRQVMLNLIGNAFKYSAKVVQPTVTIALQEDASGVTITVQDNGVGFDMAYAGKLFQPFGRLHGDAEFEGTGIGLVLSKLIVERHGGRIRAEAVPGSGATFSITLPRRQPGSA